MRDPNPQGRWEGLSREPTLLTAPTPSVPFPGRLFLIGRGNPQNREGPHFSTLPRAPSPPFLPNPRARHMQPPASRPTPPDLSHASFPHQLHSARGGSRAGQAAGPPRPQTRRGPRRPRQRPVPGRRGWGVPRARPAQPGAFPGGPASPPAGRPPSQRPHAAQAAAQHVPRRGRSHRRCKSLGAPCGRRGAAGGRARLLAAAAAAEPGPQRRLVGRRVTGMRWPRPGPPRPGALLTSRWLAWARGPPPPGLRQPAAAGGPPGAAGICVQTLPSVSSPVVKTTTTVATVIITARRQ